jgi:hypothetical protein
MEEQMTKEEIAGALAILAEQPDPEPRCDHRWKLDATRVGLSSNCTRKGCHWTSFSAKDVSDLTLEERDALRAVVAGFPNDEGRQ